MLHVVRLFWVTRFFGALGRDREPRILVVFGLFEVVLEPFEKPQEVVFEYIVLRNRRRGRAARLVAALLRLQELQVLQLVVVDVAERDLVLLGTLVAAAELLLLLDFGLGRRLISLTRRRTTALLELVLFPDSLNLRLLPIELVGDVEHLRGRQTLNVHATHVEILVSHGVELLFLLLLPWHTRVPWTDDVVIMARLLFVVGRYEVICRHGGIKFLEFGRYVLVFGATPSFKETLQVNSGATITRFTFSGFPVLLVTGARRQSFDRLIHLLLSLDLEFCHLLVRYLLNLVAIFLFLTVVFFKELHKILSIFVWVYRLFLLDFYLQFIFVFIDELFVHLLFEGGHFLVNSFGNFSFDYLLNGGMILEIKLIKTMNLVRR